MTHTTRSPSATWPKWLTTFGWVTAILLVSGQVYALATSPPDAAMGDLQKILYVHVPSAWVAMMSFIIVLAYCLLYLWKHKPEYDLAAASAAEVGTVFTALAICQGSIWGTPDLGSLVDLGSAAYNHRHHAPDLRGLPDAAVLYRGRGAQGTLERGRGYPWGDQRSHRVVFGKMVADHPPAAIGHDRHFSGLPGGVGNQCSDVYGTGGIFDRCPVSRFSVAAPERAAC